MMTTEQSGGTDKGFRSTHNVQDEGSFSQPRTLTLSPWQQLFRNDENALLENAKLLILLCVLTIVIFATQDLSLAVRAPMLIGVIIVTFSLFRLVNFTQAVPQPTTEEPVNRLVQTLEHLPHGLAHWDQNAQLIWCNAAYRDFMGLSAEMCEQGTRYSDIMSVASRPVSFDARLDDEHHRLVVATCDNQKIIQIEDIADQEQNFLTIITDNTEQHQISKAKKSLEGQYRELAKQYHAEKIAAEAASHSKTSFLAHLSHDMRTPLNHIIGFADLVQHEPFGPLGDQRYTNYVADIKRSGEELRDSFASVLDLAQLEGGEVVQQNVDIDMYKFVQDTLRRHAARAKRAGLTLDVVSLCDGHVDADPALLRRMVDNLMDNAIRFTQDGGNVFFNCWSGIDGVVLEITDSGIGIPKERVDLLSQPFVLGEAAFAKEHKGLGLGIATSRAIAELCGGSLLIDSNPGIGTTVAITLPTFIEEGTKQIAASETLEKVA